MATKRLFSKDIVRTDKFLDMSLSTQALYFHLCLDADVRGFVFPRSVMRLVGASPDDLNVLVGKGFVIPFDSGVIVIRDWNVHNNLREDREAKSQFDKEYKRLSLSEQGNYELMEYSSTTHGVLPLKIREGKVREDIYIPISEILNHYQLTWGLKKAPAETKQMRDMIARWCPSKYSLEEVKRAITEQKHYGWIWELREGKYSRVGLEMFFRTMNTKKEAVDYIGEILNRTKKETEEQYKFVQDRTR